MKRKIYVDLIAPLGMVGITILSGALLMSVKVKADDSVVDNVSVTVPASCTMSGTGMNSHTAEIPNGTYQANIGTTTLHAFCNDANGFAIYAAGYTGNEIGGTNSNKLVGTAATNNATIVTGLATSTPTPDVSNWAMKLAIQSDSGNTTGTNAVTIDSDTEGSFANYHTVPNEYKKVAHKNTATDMTASTGGVKLTTTYAAYISKTQPADTYTGQVIYTLVHPATEEPLQPQTAHAGCINYFANASSVEGTMGCQSISNDGDTVKLFASNFSREGYGFAGWSDVYDYATNSNAHFYGPNEDFVVPTGTIANGLALYAVWIKSAGTMQTDAQSVCNSLTAATYNNEGDSDEATWSITANLSSISALTDNRDNQTYAIAKLSDGKCWMIENLRLADKDSDNNDVILSSTNTNNPSLPLTNVYDTSATSNHLSPTSSIAYAADTAPEGWCDATNSAACYDQSRIRTDNTANRVSFANTSTIMSDHNVSFYSYGNYYNWYSATAGNGKYSTGNDVTTSGDICPAGWHLPTGTGSGEFGLLSNSLGGRKNASDEALNMSSSTTPTAAIIDKRLCHFPNNLLRSGSVSGASLSDRGSNGYFWSSTAVSNNSAYNLRISARNVIPGTLITNYYKYFGRTVRCIASNQGS